MMDVQYKRHDGTFVAIINGNPYHVTQSDPCLPPPQRRGKRAV